MVLTIGGILCSVAGASAVAKMQIKVLGDQLKDIEARLRTLDTRADRLDTKTETQAGKVSVLANMSSPENLRRDHINIAILGEIVSQLRREMDHQLHIHNSKHIPVSDTRKAE